MGARAVGRIDYRFQRPVAVAVPGAHGIAVIDVKIGRVGDTNFAGSGRHAVGLLLGTL